MSVSLFGLFRSTYYVSSCRFLGINSIYCMLLLIGWLDWSLAAWFVTWSILDAYCYHKLVVFSCWFVDFNYTFFCCFCYRIVFRIGFPFVLFSLWGRVLPCAMHLTYTCFLWCTSDLEEEQVQLGNHQEPEDSQQECLADGAEEEAKV